MLPYEVIESARIAAPVFEAQEWTYDSQDPFVPDAAHLVATLGRLYDSVAEDTETIATSSGRFSVQRVRDEDGETEGIEIYLQLGYVEVKYP